MNTHRENDKTTLEFRLAMVTKLNHNNHKVHWNRAHMGYLHRRLKQEVDELDVAILKNRFDGGDIQEVMDECADVANFAMMIWDNARHGIIDGSDDPTKTPTGKSSGKSPSR